MKRVLFIPGVEGMSGILGARAGKLVYAEHNNPAFDAPNGRQYARNYGHRIVLNQRVSDGAAFFSLKSKSATLISTATKTNMAILGSIKPIRVAIKAEGSLEATISQVYSYLKSVGAARVEGLSYEQYIETNLRAMLKAKNTAWGDAAPAISKTFSVTNPYYLMGGGLNQVQIRQDIFDKFFQYLAFTSDRKQNVLGGIKIDGEPISIPFSGATGTTMPAWLGVVGTGGSYLSLNYQDYLTRKGLAVDDDHGTVTFNGMSFYKPSSQTAEDGSNPIIANTAYTTIRPES